MHGLKHPKYNRKDIFESIMNMPQFRMPYIELIQHIRVTTQKRPR